MGRRSAEGVGFLAIVALVLMAGRETQVMAPPTTVAQQVAVTQSLPAPPVVEIETPKPEPVVASYVGNTRSHVFHTSRCMHANCPNCRAKFATREEAIEAGYRACRVCNP